MTSLLRHSNRLPARSHLNAVASAPGDVYADADQGDRCVESKRCRMFEFKKGLNFGQDVCVCLRKQDRA